MFVTKLKRLIVRYVALAFIFGLVNLVTTSSALAQNRGLKMGTIEINRSEGGECQYQLFDNGGELLADQNNFTVKTRAKITLDPKTNSFVFFQGNNGAAPDDSLAGISALDITANTFVASTTLTAGEAVEVKVRNSKVKSEGEIKSTTHKVQIWCLSPTDEDANYKMPANSIASVMDFDSSTPDDFLGESGRGPSAPQEWIPAVRVYKGKVISQGPGGPGMVVEDP